MNRLDKENGTKINKNEKCMHLDDLGSLIHIQKLMIGVIANNQLLRTGSTTVSSMWLYFKVLFLTKFLDKHKIKIFFLNNLKTKIN